jgi:hypothetical protein
VVAQPGGDRGGQPGDLTVERVDQLEQRVDPHPVAGAHADLAQQAHAGAAEQIAHGHRHAFLREDGVDLCASQTTRPAGGPVNIQTLRTAGSSAIGQLTGTPGW